MKNSYYNNWNFYNDRYISSKNYTIYVNSDYEFSSVIFKNKIEGTNEIISKEEFIEICKNKCNYYIMKMFLLKNV